MVAEPAYAKAAFGLVMQDKSVGSCVSFSINLYIMLPIVVIDNQGLKLTVSKNSISLEK